MIIWVVAYFIIAVILCLAAVYYSAVDDARKGRKEDGSGIGALATQAIFWPFSLLLFCLYWIIEGGPAKLYRFIWAREEERLRTEKELRTRIRELERELNL